VYCKQLLTDGSFLKRSDDTCHEPKLPTSKPCAKVDCPPQLVMREWSKVSSHQQGGTKTFSCNMSSNDFCLGEDDVWEQEIHRLAKGFARLVPVDTVAVHPCLQPD